MNIWHTLFSPVASSGHRYPAVLVVAGLLLLVSCEEVMDVSFSGDSSKNLVVQGSITTDTTAHLVTLSLTGDFFNKPDQEMVSGAEVTITDGDTTFLLSEAEPGKYLTTPDVYGEVGKTYTLDIKLPDGRTFFASDLLSPCGDIDSIRQSANYNTYMFGYGYDVLFYGQEPPRQGDNYLYLLYINNVLYSDTLSEVIFANDEFVNGNYVGDFAVYRIREADIQGDTSVVTLEMHSITPDYYDYMNAMMLETVWKGSPWDGPPASVNGNLNNRARGYFRASEVKRRSRIFTPSPRVN
jgi:hypothetical protein